MRNKKRREKQRPRHVRVVAWSGIIIAKGIMSKIACDIMLCLKLWLVAFVFFNMICFVHLNGSVYTFACRDVSCVGGQDRGPGLLH